eukprot:SAG31_NODE_15603_length_747_cov_1.121914_1_plen_121_part_01
MSCDMVALVGNDVSALLDSPSQELKSAAYSQYSRCPGGRDFPSPVGPVGTLSNQGWHWPPAQRDPATGKLEGWYMNNCEPVKASNMSWMGYTVRTSSFRYTEWTKWDGANCIAVWPETAPP